MKNRSLLNLKVITSVTLTEQKNQEEQKKVDVINNDTEKKKAQIVLDSKIALERVMMDMGKDIKGLSELEKPELKDAIIEKAKEIILGSPQGNLFADQLGEEISNQYGDVLEGLKSEVIEIPRISLTQKNAVSGFKDFNLDTERLNLHYFEEEIQRKTLRTGEDEIIKGKGKGFLQESDKAIVSELLNHTEIDYDSQSELLFKLARQAISKLETYMDAEKVRTTVQANKRLISVFIHSQMMDHFFVENAEYDEPTVHAFTKILDHNYSKYTSDKLHDIRETGRTGIFDSFKSLYRFQKHAIHTTNLILKRKKTLQLCLKTALR